MDINLNLFNLIKSHNWDKFLELINSNKNIDFNIRDDNNKNTTNNNETNHLLNVFHESSVNLHP